MKRALPLFIVLLFILSSCRQKDELTGKCFEGYYYPIERISIEFLLNSRIDCHISSGEFVGHFSDRISGHYEYDYPKISIEGNRTFLGNDVYIKTPANPDSVLINSSLGTLFFYEGDKEYVLYVPAYGVSGNWIFVFILDILAPFFLVLFVLLFLAAFAIRKRLKETGFDLCEVKEMNLLLEMSKDINKVYDYEVC